MRCGGCHDALRRGDFKLSHYPALLELAERRTLNGLQAGVREGVDCVLMFLADAMEADDGPSWDVAGQRTGDRSDLMRRMRAKYLELDPPLPKLEFINVLLITNAVEEVFFLFSRLPPTGAAARAP